MTIQWTIAEPNAELASWLPAPRLITVDEFERMIEAGVFGKEERLELIDGVLLPMTPIGSRHAACVNRINALMSRLFASAADEVIVAVQNPIALKGQTRPQPDLALLKPREDFYVGAVPRAEDVLLVVEIADTSFRSDKRVKLPMYARAGVVEVWLVDLLGDAVELHRSPNPEKGRYERSTRLDRESAEPIAPEAFPNATLRASDLFIGQARSLGEQ
jgi:Uma2 family endonuclease